MKTETLVFRGRIFERNKMPIAGAHFWIHDCSQQHPITEGFSNRIGSWSASVVGEFESPYYIVWASGPIYEVVPVKRWEGKVEATQGAETGAFIEFIPQVIRGTGGQVEEVTWSRAEPRDFIARSER